jgi:uncharacterized protein (TIRG00374 family)
VKGGKWLRWALHAAIVIGLIVAAIRYLDTEELLEAFGRFEWLYAIPIVFLGLLHVAVKGWRFITLINKFDELDRWVGMKAFMAGQAAVLVPAGTTARAGMMKEIGISSSKTGGMIIVLALMDHLVYVLMTLYGAYFWEPARMPTMIATGIIVVSAVLLGFEKPREFLSGIAHSILERFGKGDVWEKFREGIKESAIGRDFWWNLGNAVLVALCLLGALYFCIVGLGGSVSPLGMVLAFALPNMAGRLSGLPGGVGVTEFGMTGILAAGEGLSMNEAAAVVALFRVGTVLVPVAFGALMYWFAWPAAKRQANAEGGPA